MKGTEPGRNDRTRRVVGVDAVSAAIEATTPPVIASKKGGDRMSLGDSQGGMAIGLSEGEASREI